jgi:cell fate regulator YaaT (PSP1 superfamily)
MGNVVCSCLQGDNAHVRLRLSQLLHSEVEELYSGSADEVTGVEGDICEVELAGCLRDFFLNNTAVPLDVGQEVIVESDGGYDFGMVYSTGRIARKKFVLKGLDRKNEIRPVILRLATPEDLVTRDEVMKKQDEIRDICIAKIRSHALELKLVDLELRMDMQKLSIYYTSSHRVDFRNLVRDLAGEFRARIQMVQITTREEARRANAFGPCGCMLCCSSWLQKIHANPFADKTQYADAGSADSHAFNITGLCNKPKCCLGFSKNEPAAPSCKGPQLPVAGTLLSTPDGPAVIDSVDMEKKVVWIVYEVGSRKRRLPLERFNAMFLQKRERRS